MSNILRPTFGNRPAAAKPSQAAKPRYRPVRTLGEAAGHVVGIMRDEGPEGPILCVVVGPASGNAIETVGQVPDTPETGMDAEAIAYAVLRALEIVEGSEPSSAG